MRATTFKIRKSSRIYLVSKRLAKISLSWNCKRSSTVFHGKIRIKDKLLIKPKISEENRWTHQMS